MEELPCSREECRILGGKYDALKVQYTNLEKENIQFDDEREILKQQVSKLTEQNSLMVQQINSNTTAISTEEYEEIQKKWKEAVDHEKKLSERIHILEQELKDSVELKQRALDESLDKLKEHEVKLQEAVEIAQNWHTKCEELSSMGSTLEGSKDDATAQTSSAFEMMKSKLQQLEAEKQHLEQKVLDMDATNATVDRMILDFKSNFEAEKKRYIAEIQDWKKRAESIQTSTTAPDIIQDLEHKIKILQEMRVHDKETLSDVRRDLRQKQLEIDTFQTNYVHKDTWQHVELQLKLALQQNEGLKQDIDQYKLKLSNPLPQSDTKKNVEVTTQEKSIESRPIKSNPKKAPPIVMVDSQDELEGQIQVGIELDMCLDECTNMYFENQQLIQKLSTIEEALVSVQDQHAILYREFIGQQKDFKTKKQQLDQQLSASQSANEEIQIKLNRYEAILQAMQNQGDWQQTAAEMTRKLASFEVNQARLARQYNILMDEKQAEYTRRIATEEDLLEMEKILKCRIQYLESWRLGATKRMKSMQKALDQSILKRQYNELAGSYKCIQENYAHHLEKWNSLHASYVETIDLPAQIARLLHENALLTAKNQDAPIATLQNERIQELEASLETCLSQLKEIKAEGPPEIPNLIFNKNDSTQMVVEHRVAELEQCCTALEQEVQKHKSIASLAASQANTLSQRQTRHRDEITQLEERLRELSSRSDDDAIIGQLQQKLITIQANYHAFTDRYEKAMEMQRSTQLQVNTLTLQMDAAVQEHLEAMEHSRQQTQVLELTIAEFKQGDLLTKIRRMEAMSNRIQGLEEELVQLHSKKRHLERRIEELESGQVIPSHKDDNHEMERYKHRISVLEQKERTLLEQIQQLSNQNIPKESHQEKWMKINQEIQTKLDQTLFEMDQLKTKCSRLLQECSQKDIKLHELQMKVDNLILESQLKTTHEPIQTAATRTTESMTQSPSVASKIGYYEKDHVALQEAAQATIASLKALVQDKNIHIEEYQRQIEKLRQEYEVKQRLAHEEQENRNRRLYEDNHQYIQQLKEAMEKIHQLEDQGGGKAVVAAREMHDELMEQLKQAHMEIELKSQVVEELMEKIEQLRNSKQTAESRCGEALEEITALQKVNHSLVENLQDLQKEKHGQTAQWRADLQAKDKKMALLRDAIIKLKEEFLKAQEKQAEESVREKHKQTIQQDDRLEELQQKNSRLQDKCKMLQEKIESQTSDFAELTTKYKKALANSRPKPPKENIELKGIVASLRDELARCKAKLGAQATQETTIDSLEAKIRVLEAKNLALREASAIEKEQASKTNQDDEAPDARRRAWENEKKLKRRIEILSSRVDDKSEEIEKLTDRNQKLSEAFDKVQSQLEEQIAERKSAPLPHERSREELFELDNCYRRIVELQQQILDARQSVISQLELEPSAERNLQRETKILELSFQVESLQMELHRLRQSTQQHRPINTPQTPLKAERKNANVSALQDVIENMKRVMEKLRSENDRLKRQMKSISAPTKPSKELQQAHSILESTKADLQQLRIEHADLARKFRALGAKFKALKESQKDQVTTSTYITDMERLHHIQLHEKEMQIQGLQEELHRSKLSHQGDDDPHGMIAQLQEENTRLAQELSAFDFEFFEEIEDLKFKYAQAIRQKQALERELGRKIAQD